MSVTTTDPIADMLTRIRNAINVRKHEVRMPHSNVKQSVAELLKSSNFVDDVRVEGEGISKELIVTINAEHTNARITEIARLSKTRPPLLRAQPGNPSRQARSRYRHH